MLARLLRQTLGTVGSSYGPVGLSFGRRLVAVLLAASVAMALVVGGRSFLWCPWMQRTITQDCCHKAERPDSERPALERSNCCETKVVPMAPPASAERGALPQLSAELATVPAELPRFDAAPADMLSVFVSARERGARAGPGGPLYALHCAYLI